MQVTCRLAHVLGAALWWLLRGGQPGEEEGRMAWDLGDGTALVQEGCRGPAEVQWVGLGCTKGRVHRTCTHGWGQRGGQTGTASVEGWGIRSREQEDMRWRGFLQDGGGGGCLNVLGLVTGSLVGRAAVHLTAAQRGRQARGLACSLGRPGSHRAPSQGHLRPAVLQQGRLTSRGGQGLPTRQWPSAPATHPAPSSMLTD